MLPGRIIVISFTAPQMLGRFEDDLQLGLEMFADPERATYEALGFGRGRGFIAARAPRTGRP